MNTVLIAKVCHESISSYCEAIDDKTKNVPWNQLPPNEKEVLVGSINFCLLNPGANAEDLYNHWKQKTDDIDYNQLPNEQKIIIKLLVSIVNVLK